MTVGSDQTLYTVIRLRINVRERGKEDGAQVGDNCLAVYHKATLLCFFMRSCERVYNPQ